MTTTRRAGAPAPCYELRDWYDGRLLPRLRAALERGVADPKQVVVLDGQLRAMFGGASPCREHAGRASHQAARER